MNSGRIYISSTTNNIYTMVHGILWTVHQGDNGDIVLSESFGIGDSEELMEYTGSLKELFHESAAGNS